MQQESFGRGIGGPVPGPVYRPIANPAGNGISASSYGGPPSDPSQPPEPPGGGYGQGGGQGGYGQGEPPPPPPPGGYDPNQGGYGGPAAAPPPPQGWGGAPGYPPPAMPQWSDSGQQMSGQRGPGSYAGWWARVGATIIDLIIIGIVSEILRAIFGRTGGDVVGVLVSLFYATILLGNSRGQTVGLMALGTRVVDANTGQSIGYGRAFLRWLVFELLWVLFFIPGLINVLWPLWDRRNQTLHDKAASSVLIKIR